jgi:TrmH family RNA methyltransferase
MDKMTNHLHIASQSNDRVKGWAGLLEKKQRDQRGEYLIEGIHLVMEAILCKADISVIVYDADKGVPRELQSEPYASAAASQEWISASRAVMSKCSDTDTPPPVFAVVRKPKPGLSALFRPHCLVIGLDGLSDPGNVGTIIRSADAVGADAVILGKGTVDLYNPKTVRSSMGSIFHLPIIEGDLAELIPQGKERGIAMAGTSLQAEKNVYDCDWRRSVWLIMGNESRGLSPQTEAALDEAVIIPMPGQAESLNVAMASTIMLYEALRQRKFYT